LILGGRIFLAVRKLINDDRRRGGQVGNPRRSKTGGPVSTPNEYFSQSTIFGRICWPLAAGAARMPDANEMDKEVFFICGLLLSNRSILVSRERTAEVRPAL